MGSWEQSAQVCGKAPGLLFGREGSGSAWHSLRWGRTAQRGSYADRLEADAVDSDTDRVSGKFPVALPVIRGAQWFGPEFRPFVLRIELPLTSDEMVAALYTVGQPNEIDSGEEVCGCVAITLLVEGLPALQARTARLRASELSGAVDSPEFLVLCRQRVAELAAEWLESHSQAG
jgi:hypothetical protein